MSPANKLRLVSGTRFKLDQNKPIPKRANGLRMYPWDLMQIGDSFFVPGKKANSLLSSARSFTKGHDKKWTFVARTVYEGTTGARIWRRS